MTNSLYKQYAFWLLGLLLFAAPLRCWGDQATSLFDAPVRLPSAEPSGNHIVDQIWFFPSLIGSTEAPAPAVILLPALGGDRRELRDLENFARNLNQHGMSAVIMLLPYHFDRLPPHDSPFRHFTSRHVDEVIQAFSQSASDVRTVVTWLTQQPNVDPRRIGVIGISLGAIVAHLTMGQDARVTAGVGILGGGDIAHLRRNSWLYRWLHPNVAELSEQERDQIARIDPITYADRNLPRHVLMIQAAHDMIVPPRNADVLWIALGRPPIRWLDTNHFMPQLMLSSLWKTSETYLANIWNGSDLEGRHLPSLYVPTIKVGLLIGPNASILPALQWQALSFAQRRDHMSLLHADLGVEGFGFRPFLGMAATLNPYMDVGLGYRFLSNDIRPYVSVHFVF